MKPIEHPSIPTPAGHYSAIVEHAGLLYVSGQLPVDPDTKAMPDGIEAQTAQALANVERLLQAAGASLSDVIQSRVYISDVDLWGRLNVTYAGAFGEHKPARVVVPTGPLHHGALVEIEVVAVAPGSPG